MFAEQPNLVATHSILRRLGARIREARLQHALTQADLAALAGVSRPSLANIEAGRQNVTILQLASIANALGLAVTNLL